MKKYLLLFTTFFSLTIAHGQTPSWLWTKGSSGNGINEGWCAATDTFGNAFIGGFMQSDSIIFGTNTLITNGQQDIIIAKYNSSGNLLWAKNSGGTSPDVCFSIATDVPGNIYATGFFQSSALVLGADTLNTNGSQDVILIKYDTAGNALWARSAGGAFTDIGYSVSCDASGNVYIAGIFDSPAITFGSTTLTKGSGDAIFIAKYDNSGNVLWAKSATGTNALSTKGVAADIFGNAYITGSFSSPSVSFGSCILNNPNPGADLVFLVKYNPFGNVLWAKSSLNIGSAYGIAVATDFSGNSYITGDFMYCDSISFGQFTLQNANQGNGDVFVVKYDTSGNELWANKGSGGGDDCGFGIATDNSNNIYISGGYDRGANQYFAITFGSYTLPFPPGGKDPMFIVKYDSGGSVLCASSLQSGGDDFSGIAADNSGNAYIGGDFFTTPFIVGNDTLYLNNNGDEQFFLSKYRCETTTAPVINLMSSDTSFCDKHCINFYDLSTNNPTSWQWFFPGSDSLTSAEQNPTNICYNTYGSFDVTLIACNAAGCDTLVLPGFINEYPAPTPTIIQSNDTLFSSPGVAYQWWSVDSGIIAGANNYYYIPTQGGSYYVIVTDTTGCEGASNTIIITGINSPLERGRGCVITPNPNNGTFTITLTSSITKDFSLRITNPLGQTIFNKQGAIGKGQQVVDVNMDGTAKGLYMVEVVNGGKVYRGKVIIH
ncbi:MAG: SBBP repeat-containing protein [Bacteroidia bacterium]